MNQPERIHCKFCEQTYFSSQFDKCSLCGKAGCLIRPSSGEVPPGLVSRPGSQPSSHLEPGEVDPNLGAELMRCRPLHGGHVLRAQGYVMWWPLYYIFGPFLMLPFVAFMTTLVFVLAFAYLIADVDISIFEFVFVCTYLFFLWLCYIVPRQNHLILFENGIRVRLGFKRLSLAFDSIAAIFQGRDPSRVEKGLISTLGLFKPRQAQWAQEMNQTALTIETKDGERIVFKAFLTHFDPDDLNHFFDEVIQKNPHLASNL